MNLLKLWNEIKIHHAIQKPKKNIDPNLWWSWEGIKTGAERVTWKKLYGLAKKKEKDKEIKSELLTALQTKGADFILWSERYEPKNLVKLSA